MVLVQAKYVTEVCDRICLSSMAFERALVVVVVSVKPLENDGVSPSREIFEDQTQGF